MRVGQIGSECLGNLAGRGIWHVLGHWIGLT